jgi:predicted AlkP superfamily pyrophosphatase or phosphodiesterase
MKLRWILLALLTLAAASAASAAPVLLISIDGLRPGDVLEAKKRGLNLPHLESFVRNGAYATGVRAVLPTLTYPDHTTLITGVWPAQHGIAANAVFDPSVKNLEGWYWYSGDIKVPTLWDAVHAKHGVVASISWPVSVGTNSIDYNIPEYWRAWDAEDAKLLRALSTPGLAARLEHDTAVPFAATLGSEPENDAARTRYAGTLIQFAFPEFMTLHLVSLDHVQHGSGPGSPEARIALERIDGEIGVLLAAARAVQPDVTVAVVSDHGFAPASRQMNLGRAFAEAGLVGLDGQGKVASWDAMPWGTGGSAIIMLAHPDDPALKAKVAALLAKLAAEPGSGIAKVIDKPGIEARGGAREASFWVDFKPGIYFGSSFTGPLLTAAKNKGTHGYFPEDKEMRAAFLIMGPAIKKKNLGEIDMRDIAPTLAKILGVPLPSATGNPLF